MKAMGLVRADIELVNIVDVQNVEEKYVPLSEVRSIGAYMLSINEDVQEQLGLLKTGIRKAMLANGDIIKCYDSQTKLNRIYEMGRVIKEKKASNSNSFFALNKGASVSVAIMDVLTVSHRNPIMRGKAKTPMVLESDCSLSALMAESTVRMEDMVRL
ncbi:hypothetical protein CHS0354_000559 [Potamilus streckersoni]|uniref:Uncharacterized protein n=1 Tax=Potamilus streckersoni TaxID=2493646 RepID=A0AAE0T6Z7_9BIVA|nr:hypothetical protein CHS0354_000559 [Potamilus streckersoni]